MCSSLLLVVVACVGVVGGNYITAVNVERSGEGRWQLGPKCSSSTRYVTLTSTRTFPSTLYSTTILHVPTTVYQDVTEWKLKPLTVVHTQTLTSYPPPRLLTTTQVLTATRYVSQVQVLTETNYVTSTESLTFTDTEVATVYATRTRQVTTLDTVTTTVTSTLLKRGTLVLTTTQYQFVTHFERVPEYATHTFTSYYPQYHTITHTRTENEYVSQTSILIQTVSHTRCSSLYA